MIYLYHSIPKNLQGNILYPLNTLKERHPIVYEEQVSKYLGREHIKEQRIPILGCLWNDVLHFSAVNPKEVKQALIEAGRNPDFTMNYYQVDPKLIDLKKAIVYLYTHTNNKDKMNEKNFASYNPDEIEKISVMPQGTKDYYKKIIENGGQPLLYHGIPHILYRGTVDTSDLPTISI